MPRKAEKRKLEEGGTTPKKKTAVDSSASIRPPLAINGFRLDVATLVATFTQKDSLRFEDFVAVWEEMKFGFIWGGIAPGVRGLTELYEFAEKCFREAVMLCLKPNDPITRVAGIYLLYSLYISRPLHCHAKIRIHPVSEMLPIATFIDELKEENHLKPVYCFVDLHEQSAFCYTLTAYEMGSHTLRAKVWRDDEINIKMYIPDMPTLLESDALARAMDSDRVYARTKAELMSDPSQSTAREGTHPLGYIKGNLEERLQVISDDYSAAMGKLYASHATSGPSQAPSTSAAVPAESEEETVGTRRQRLRLQQMARNTGTT
ncbi:hypothetical protein BV898_07716 [Hypsibius exemplaris]|uniref:snRNA-activating protein complex subunit 1 n=1 Tax=Hypsibius exemplaris TaxID=2072580 RepID=A0A1W0WSF0_HYPEX|nr:hypothetical protein BV898_07716 [Hypsibius exemplaris]